MKICIVTANYYPKISKNLISGASNILKKNGIKNFKNISVPGVFEIPVIISKLINKYNGFIALGCIIKGKTQHFDLISKTTTEAIMKLSIDRKKPIGYGIITCLNMKQAIERKKKGKEAAIALISILSQ